jgi:hypothetical protein
MELQDLKANDTIKLYGQIVQVAEVRKYGKDVILTTVHPIVVPTYEYTAETFTETDFVKGKIELIERHDDSPRD